MRNALLSEARMNEALFAGNDFWFDPIEVRALHDAACALEPLLAACATEREDFAAIEYRRMIGWRCEVWTPNGPAESLSLADGGARARRFFDPGDSIIKVAEARLGDPNGHSDFRCCVQPGMLVAWCATAIVALRTSSVIPDAAALWSEESVTGLRGTVAEMGGDAVLHVENEQTSAHRAMRSARTAGHFGGPAPFERLLQGTGFRSGVVRPRTLRQRVAHGAAVLYTTVRGTDLRWVVGDVVAAIACDATAIRRPSP